MFSIHIIIFFLKLNSIFSYIAVPFTTIKENITPSEYVSTFMYSSFRNNIVTKINIGTPSQEINLRIKTLRIYILVNSIQMGTYKITRFNESNSSTYIPLSDKSYNYGQPDFTFAVKSKDIINFGNNLKLENFSFILGTEDYDSHRESGVLGLQMADSDWRVKDMNFIKQLKERNLIKNYSFFIQYDKKDSYNESTSGNLFIGIKPHEYDSKKYKQKNFKEFYGEIIGGSMGFRIKESYYGTNLINKDFKAQLAIEDYFIRGTKIFKDILLEKFFQKKIDAYLCYESKFSYSDNKDLHFFYCKNNINLSEFENIVFTVDNFGMNDDSDDNENNNSTHLIIELNYNDLFTEFDDKYYFLMYFPERSYETDYFKFSKIVFQKYLLNFNLDTKKIGFYLEDKNNEEIDKKDDDDNDETNKENNNDNNNKKEKEESIVPWILVGILIFLVLVLIVYIIYITFCRKRTKRANELMDDNYTYEEGINQ